MAAAKFPYSGGAKKRPPAFISRRHWMLIFVLACIITGSLLHLSELILFDNHSNVFGTNGSDFPHQEPDIYGDTNRPPQRFNQERFDTAQCAKLDSAIGTTLVSSSSVTSGSSSTNDDASSLGILADLNMVKIDLQQWTNCRSVPALPGWVVEHCTTPPNYVILPSQSSAFDAERKQEGQGSPSSKPVDYYETCSPTGYFKVQRLSTPSTLQTLGSDRINPLDRCRFNPAYPLAPTNWTLNHDIAHYAGPDTFRILVLGPERLLLTQQQNLGNCTYGFPYVASRPGRFWVERIEHVDEDYQAFRDEMVRHHQGEESVINNEETIRNKQKRSPSIGTNILLTSDPKARTGLRTGSVGGLAASILNWKSSPSSSPSSSPPSSPEGESSGSKDSFSSRLPIREIKQDPFWYEFDICEDCVDMVLAARRERRSAAFGMDELENTIAGLQDKVCEVSTLKSMAQYGIYVPAVVEQQDRSRIMAKAKGFDVDPSDYIWVPARPSCRFYPALSSLEPKPIPKKGSTLSKESAMVVEGKEKKRIPTRQEKERDREKSKMYKHRYIFKVLPMNENNPINQKGRPKGLPFRTAAFQEALECLALNRTMWMVGGGKTGSRYLFRGLSQRLRGTKEEEGLKDDGHLTTSEHIVSGGIKVQQDNDQDLKWLWAKIQFELGTGPVSQATASHKLAQELHSFRRVDTVMLSFGYPGSSMSTTQWIDKLQQVMSGLLQIQRRRRQAAASPRDSVLPRDLKIIWLGVALPSVPDSSSSTAAGGGASVGGSLSPSTPLMSSSALLSTESSDALPSLARLKYLETLANKLIDSLHQQQLHAQQQRYSRWSFKEKDQEDGNQGIGIDRLQGFEMLSPFWMDPSRPFEQQTLAWNEVPLDAVSSGLIHKLDLCQRSFQPYS